MTYSPHALLSHEPVLKLLRSAQGAFPIQSDPWQDLATGLWVDRDQVLRWVEELHRAGVISGVRLEPDPAHPDIQEWWMPAGEELLPEGVMPRWMFVSEAGIRLRSVAQLKAYRPAPEYREYAWPASEWFKCGTFLDPAPDDGSTLREPTPERSYFVQQETYARTVPLLEEQAALLEALSQPVMPELAEPFWKGIGSRISLPTLSVAREETSRVLLSKRTRRFHLVVQPGAVGYPVAALVAWALPVDSAAPASRALGIWKAAADVVIRQPTQKYPYTLSAVLLGRSTEDLNTTLQTLELKWKRPIDWVLKGTLHYAE
jgi:hypothetical protein